MQETQETQETRVDPCVGKIPGGENDNTLRYSCQDNTMATGAWWAPVHVVVKSWKWMSMPAGRQACLTSIVNKISVISLLLQKKRLMFDQHDKQQNII